MVGSPQNQGSSNRPTVVDVRQAAKHRGMGENRGDSVPAVRPCSLPLRRTVGELPTLKPVVLATAFSGRWTILFAPGID